VVLDGFDKLFYKGSPEKDPLADPEAFPTRVYRGGAFDEPATAAKSGARHFKTPAYTASSIGVRPARVVTQ
jgi:formylglycine-generating enzyme required for sulfatase activity